jgi:ankyrin repeat protein
MKNYVHAHACKRHYEQITVKLSWKILKVVFKILLYNPSARKKGLHKQKRKKKMSRRKQMSAKASKRTLLDSFPLEIILLIAQHLDLGDVLVMMKTCRYMATALDSALYQNAVVAGKHKQAFLYAVIWGKTTIISKFLNAGVSMKDFPGKRSYYYRNGSCVSIARREALRDAGHPLLVAAMFGQVDAVRVLVTEGKADIDFRDYSRNTALHYAIQECHLDVVKLLLRQGATLMSEEDSLDSPFMHAVQVGNKEALEMIYDEIWNRCVPQKDIVRMCQRACFQACEKDLIDIVDFFLGRGIVDVNNYRNGHSLLYTASNRVNFSMVRLLVKKYGARMESERDTGVVNTLYKKYQKANSIVKYLIQSGCNVANGKRHACALLHIALGAGHRPNRDHEMVQLLKENGCHKDNCLERDQKDTKCWKAYRYTWRKKLSSEDFWAFVEEDDK